MPNLYLHRGSLPENIAARQSLIPSQDFGKKLYVTQNRGPASNSNTENWGINFRQRELVG
jgi:hypothetical protein